MIGKLLSHYQNIEFRHFGGFPFLHGYSLTKSFPLSRAGRHAAACSHKPKRLAPPAIVSQFIVTRTRVRLVEALRRADTNSKRRIEFS